MTRIFRGWWRACLASVEEHPILLAWFCVFVVQVTLNGTMGHELFGWEVGLLFMAVAVVGAYMATQMESFSGAQRAWAWIIVAGAILLGQWCGWQQLGLRISRGLGTLTAEAGTHNTAQGQLDAATKERAAIGMQRPVDEIAALRLRECNSGVGPRCTALKAEEARALRAVELDAALPKLAQQLADAPPTTDAGALFMVPIKIGNFVLSTLNGLRGKGPVSLTSDDVIFAFSVFATALADIIAELGPWLLQRFTRKAPAPVEEGPRRLLTHQPRVADAAGEPHADETQLGSAVSPHAGDFEHASSLRENSPGGVGVAPPGADGLNRPLATPAGNSPASMHGAPINLTLNMGNAAAAPPAAPQAPAASDPAARIDAVSDRNVARLRAVTDAFTPETPDKPVDRSGINAVIDGLLLFHTANVIQQGGACVAVAEMYRRYCEWAGPRAMADGAFATLYEAATNTPTKMLGGVLHYTGVRLTAQERASA